MYAGDFFKDGIINSRDAAFIKKYYGKNLPEYDIDGDNIIGYTEKYYLRKNFEK